MKQVLFFLLLFIMHVAVFGQTGMVSGKVTHSSTGQKLVGVAVSSHKGAGRTTDVEGYFSLKLPAGKHTITFSSTGFASKTVEDVVVEAGKTTELNVVLSEKAKELEGVTVSANSAKRETVASVLSLQKNNSSVSDGISSELIRRTPDNNVGEVLKRVTGTSVQEDKYVIVRGLNDRYNIATVNGAVMPSTEPDRRTFSFDVIPSAMIDNVLINKTATPDMPGEFSGGIIQVTTKDIPFKKSFAIGLSTSYNTISTGRNFEPGKMSSGDYFGFDDGTRGLSSKFPSARKWSMLDQSGKERVSRLMNNNYGDRYDGVALPGIGAQFSFGTKFNFNNSGVLGITGALNYKNSQNIEFGTRNGYGDNTSTDNYLFRYIDTTYSFSTNVGGLLNIGYKKGRNKFVLKNLVNRIFENNNTLREGPNYNDLQYVKKSQINVIYQKTILSSQLEGEHSIGSRQHNLKWNVNYAYTEKDQPDYKVLPYQVAIDQVNDKNAQYEVATRNTYRFWSNLTEHNVGGKVDYAIPFELFKHKSTFKTGVLTQIKQREFSARIFRYEKSIDYDNVANPATLPAHLVFSDANMNEKGFYLNDITKPTSKYDANSMLYAGYAMMDHKLNARLRLIWGVRVESFGFKVNTFDNNGVKVKINKDYVDILPSANVVYSLSGKSNIRFSASQTVSRPDFRELANFAYWDFTKAFIVSGNPNLERSQNTNIDLRFENYPTSGEILSASVFFKYFNKPIEQVMHSNSSAEYQAVTFTNPSSAVAYGFELDLRKKLSFINESSTVLDNMVVSANASFIQSRVSIGGQDFRFWDSKRPMQGQSPYLINAGLSYAQPQLGLTASVMYNRIGHRIEVVGNETNADIYENGRDIVDVQLSKKFARNKAEVKLTVANIFDAAQVLYQNVEDKKTSRSYNSSDDRVIWSKRFGRTISLGFNYNF